METGLAMAKTQLAILIPLKLCQCSLRTHFITYRYFFVYFISLLLIIVDFRIPDPT